MWERLDYRESEPDWQYRDTKVPPTLKATYLTSVAPTITGRSFALSAFKIGCG